jgi:hypothetical protein
MLQSQLCGKVVHFTYDSADIQARDLADRYGYRANTYICKKCTVVSKRTIWHVGYGRDAGKLAKRARRHRKQASARKRKRTR